MIDITTAMTTLKAREVSPTTLKPKQVTLMTYSEYREYMEPVNIGLAFAPQAEEVNAMHKDLSGLNAMWEGFTWIDEIIKVNTNGTTTTVKQLVRGMAGVCRIYTTLSGSVYEYCPTGIALTQKGLLVGQWKDLMGLTSKQAESVCKYNPLSCITDMTERWNKNENGEWVKDVTYEVKYRYFSNKASEQRPANQAAAEGMGWKATMPKTLAEMKAINKRFGRFAGWQTGVHMSDGKDAVLFYEGKVYNHRVLRVGSFTRPQDLDYDGMAFRRSSIFLGVPGLDMDYIRESKGTFMGFEAKDHGAKTSTPGGEGKAMTLSVPDRDWPVWAEEFDIVLMDNFKSEIAMDPSNGIELYCFGLVEEQGHKAYLDNMLCMKSTKFSDYCLMAEEKETDTLLDNIQTHMLAREDMGMNMNVESDVATKMKGIGHITGKISELRGKEGNSAVLAWTDDNLDVFGNPLTCYRGSSFLLGDEGTKVSRYRSRIPNGLQMKMVVYHPEFMKSLPAPADRELVLHNHKGILVSYCDVAAWKVIVVYCGGPDLDDSFQAWVFKVSKAVSGLVGCSSRNIVHIVRQPDGAADGNFFNLNITDQKIMELFSAVPKGSKADAFVTDIHERRERILAVVPKAVAIDAEKAEYAGKMKAKQGGIGKVSSNMKYEKTSNWGKKVKKVTKKAGKLDPLFMGKVADFSWDNFTATVPHSIGVTVNTSSAITAPVLDGYGTIDYYRYMTCMMGHLVDPELFNTLEIVIDFDNKGAGTPEQWVYARSSVDSVLRRITKLEYSHVIGKSKGFKPRVTTVNGVSLNGILSRFNFFKPEEFSWPKCEVAPFQWEEMDKNIVRKITLMSKLVGERLGNLTHKQIEDIQKELGTTEYPECVIELDYTHRVWSDLGKELIYNLFGVELYKGGLTSYYDNLRHAFLKSYKKAKLICSQHQLNWFTTLCKSLADEHGYTTAEHFNQHVRNLLGEDGVEFLRELYLITGNQEIEDFDDKAAMMVQLVTEWSEKEGCSTEKVFDWITTSDLFQFRFTAKATKGFTNLLGKHGMVSKLRTAVDTLRVLETADRKSIPVTEVEGCTPEAEEFEKTGLLSETMGKSVNKIDLFSWCKPRTVDYIKSGRLISHKNGEAKYALDFLIDSTHWHRHYGRALARVSASIEVK